MNDIRYFKHDSNARNDIKINKIRKKYGLKGYGIYFCVIEMLCCQKKYTMKLDLESLAYDIQEDEKVIEDILKNYDLFTIKKGLFYSSSLKKRMARLDNIREVRRQAAKKRWEKDKPGKQKRSHGYTQEEADKLGLH